MNCPICGNKLVEVEGVLTCDNPECVLWFKEIEPGYRVHGTGPQAHISKTFWASVYGDVFKANLACADHLGYLDSHRSGRGLPDHQKLHMVARHRVRVGGEWHMVIGGTVSYGAGSDPAAGVF